MKVGIKYQVDVKNLLKEYFYQGKKGTYVTLTSFVDLDNTDEYDNNGFIKQECGKDTEEPIVGNSRVFWKEDQQAAPQQQGGHAHLYGRQSNNQIQQPQQQGGFQQPQNQVGLGHPAQQQQGGFLQQKVNPQEPSFDDDINF